MEAIASMRRSWRSFARVQPGQRFIQQYRRAHRSASIARRVLRIGFGIIVTAAGMVLWFLPGPGWLFVMLGLATLAGEWRSLAEALDRLELYARARWHRLQRWWHAASPTH
jgi:hypothetical protein